MTTLSTFLITSPSESAEKNTANWRAYIDKHTSHEHWWLYREAYRFINGNYTPALLVSQLYRIADTDRNDELSSRVQSLWWHFPHISIDAAEHGRLHSQPRVRRA
jgi:hypothetical protein